MKSLFTALLCMAAYALSAQEVNASLELDTPYENNDCASDTRDRIYLLQRIDNNQISTVGNYIGTGCKFQLSQKLPYGHYNLLISGLTFEEEMISFEINDQSAGKIVLGPVLLREKNNTLQEVTIFGNKRQFIKVDSDKMTVSIKENTMLNTGSSLDAIKKLPGVVASPSGGLTLNGRGVAVYIDGAPSSLTGDDLLNYLAGLPAQAIEKVELIHNPGASYDANSSGTVINIVTSSKRMKGVNASFNVNYNFNRNQKPSPQILLNGKEKNLSWQTMLGYNYIEGEQWVDTDQEFTSFSPAQHLLQKRYIFQINRNLYFRNGLNYKLTENSNLLVNYNMNLGNDRLVFDNSTFGTGIDFGNVGSSKAENAIHELSMQYRTNLDTLGRSLSVTAYSNFFKRNPLTQSTSVENAAATYNNADVDFHLQNHYLKYDLEIPFQKADFSITTGGKYNLTEVTDLGRYNFESNDRGIFDSGIYGSEIDFRYRERNLAFYAEARQKIRKLNLTAGLRFENYEVDRDASTIADEIKYTNRKLFPNVSAMYELLQDINLSASYSKKISQPGYYTIDPNNNSAFNRYNSSTGDITLQPVLFDNYEIQLSAFQYVQIGANYTQTRNSTNFVFSAEPGELVSNQSFLSIDKLNTLSAYVSFPIPFDYFFKGKEVFKERLNTIDKMNYMFVNINYVQNKIQGFDHGFSDNDNITYSAQAQILLPWGVTNNMSYFYLPKGSWEIYQILEPIQQFDISFSKEFANRKLKLGLHCFDVFNSNEVNANIAGRNLNTTFYQKRDSRMFRISLTYNFGNLKLQKDNTDIHTDKINQGGGILK
jgi:iron complex outermembrane receptor protein